MSEEAKWYVCHTYSGYENKVATNLETIVENRKLQDWIQEIAVPTDRYRDQGRKKTRGGTQNLPRLRAGENGDDR